MRWKPFASDSPVFLCLGSADHAVEPGLPSKTAVYAAAARAVGSKDPNPERRNPDYFAIQFLGPREGAVLPDYDIAALDLDFGDRDEASRRQASDVVTCVSDGSV